MSLNVLPTKLFVPTPDPDVVVRTRLLELLSAGSRAPVVLVSAPAGAGKTTLVSTWVQREEAPIGWLSLDASDNDPLAFLACLIEACATLRQGTGERAAALLSSTPPPEPAVVAAALIADLARLRDAGTIVLDDYHLMEDPVVHEIMLLLIERMPPGFTLVLVTRSDPPLPLSRLRARGRLLEIRAADLRFDVVETTAFLARFSDRTFRPESIETLAERTEGWAAGLQLAGLALRRTADPDAFIAGFAGTHAYIADYLTDEVLDGLPPEQQEFLVRSSVLNRLSGPLCDAALARPGSDAMLDTLSRANLFLVALDGERRWFRYHHLFRDLLRRRGHGSGDSERREILVRASAWCETNGLADDAIGYAVEAGDTDRAAELVGAHALRALAAGEALRTLRWIRLLPGEVVRSSPDHCVIAAWSHNLIEEHAAVVAYAERGRDRLDAGERPYRHIQDVDGHVRVILAGALTLDGSPAGSRTAHEQLTDALAAVSPDNLLLRATAEVMDGNVLRLLARYEESLAAYVRCQKLAERAGSELLRVAGATGIAEVLLLQGKPRAAITAAEAVLDRPRALRGMIGTQAANLYAVRAKARFEIGDAAGAEQDIGRAWSAMGAAEQSANAWRDIARFGPAAPSAFHSSVPGIFFGIGIHVRLLIRRGELKAAGDQLDHLEGRLSAAPDPVARAALEALRIRLWVAGEERTRLQRWSRAAETPATGCAFWDQTSVLTRARAALCGRDPATALHLLEPLLPELEASRTGLALAEARVLLALAADAAGRAGVADASVDAALELTSARGLVAVWLDEGEAVRPLLQQAVARATAAGRALSHALALIAALDGLSPPRARAGLPELSERELEILRRVAAGHTNQEIADELFVAVGTVKKHTHNIYQKIGVRSRTQAVRAARDNGLLVQEK